VTTTYLHLLTVCAALLDQPRACVTYAAETRKACEAGMRIAYAALYSEDRGIYIVCTPTRVLTATIRPEARP